MPFILAGQPMIQTIFRDITERQQLEDQLRQAQKMEAVGRLAGGVAHDFNNLLTVIQANTEFLLADLDMADPRREDAVEIRSSCDRAAGLTRQLLAFSRKQIIEPKPLDLRVVIAGMKSMLTRIIGEDVTLEIAVHDAVGCVMGDAGQIEQVLMNLVINARDAMADGGRILIELADVELTEQYAIADRVQVVPGSYVRIAVSDTGSGMTPEIRARIFEPFFTTKPVGQGTGLGLATAYGIIKQSAGHIWVYSEPGSGTTFKLYLPRIGTGRMAAAAVNAVELPRRGSETILLVEDEAALRSVARRMLTGQGYVVMEAANGREALDTAMKHPGRIDLVLTDVVMPEMSGGALAERLRGVRPEARILFMSGYTDGDIVRRGVLQPGITFIQKPFAAARLLEVVRDTLDKD
jgi:nitrogen-specific signal transduction histidine kinase/ActR/RegA family two-component response regulator